MVSQKQMNSSSVALLLLLKKHRNLELPGIEIGDWLSETELIDLLTVDSSLTESKAALYHTLLKLIVMRYTKVILYVLSEEGDKGKG